MVVNIPNIHKVLGLRLSGIPIFAFDFSRREFIFDEMLITGFMSAIDGFSNELFKKEKSQIIIDLGEEILSLFKTKELGIIIFSENNISHLREKFEFFLKKLEELFPDTENLYPPEPKKIEIIRKGLIRILFHIPISDDWIPVLNPSHHSDFGEIHSDIAKKIDGKTEIRNLPSFNKNDPEHTYELLNYAYYDKYIKFINFIEPKDYVMGTEDLIDFISSRNAKSLSFRAEFKKINLVNFARKLEDISHVEDLIQEFGDSTILLLEHLFELEYIRLVDENHRNLLVAIEIFNDFVIILSDFISSKKLLPQLESYLIDFNVPEISKRIIFYMDKIKCKLDESLLFYNSEEIKQYSKQWINFCEYLLDKYYPQYKKKIIERCYSLLTEHYVEFIHDKDFGLLDSLLFKLEKLFI